MHLKSAGLNTVAGSMHNWLHRYWNGRWGQGWRHKKTAATCAATVCDVLKALEYFLGLRCKRRVGNHTALSFSSFLKSLLVDTKVQSDQLFQSSQIKVFTTHCASFPLFWNPFWDGLIMFYFQIPVQELWMRLCCINIQTMTTLKLPTALMVTTVASKIRIIGGPKRKEGDWLPSLYQRDYWLDTLHHLAIQSTRTRDLYGHKAIFICFSLG